jgi:hypothetical protein
MVFEDNDYVCYRYFRKDTERSSEVSSLAGKRVTVCRQSDLSKLLNLVAVEVSGRSALIRSNFSHGRPTLFNDCHSTDLTFFRAYLTKSLPFRTKEKIVNEIEIAGKVLESKVVEKVYDDAASPGFRELGKVGVDVVKTARLILAPLQIAATFQDRFERFLRELNERVPEDRRIEVVPEIAGPALESMRYLNEGSALWDMFREILFKASDKNFTELVHPAFVQIVRQLTRDEAYMLYKLKSTNFQIVDRMDLNRTLNRFDNLKIESSTIPESELLIPSSMNVYYAHLQSLSLVQWPVTKQDPIMMGNTQTGIRRHSTIELTDFGRLFVSACLPPNGIDKIG